MPKPDPVGRMERAAQPLTEESKAAEQELARPQEQQHCESERPPIASFESNAVKQATDGMTRFEVRKDDFERQTGVRIERGKVYAVEWEMEGLGASRKILDGSSESSRMAFFAPKEASESIAAGEKHAVHVHSVGEISANNEHRGVFYVTAHREGAREDSARLDIRTSTFEKRSRVKVEEGKTYEIQGKVDGKDFSTTHTGSRDDRHVVISMYGELAKAIEPGKEHTVIVKSVEEKRTLTVTGEGPSTRLTIQKRQLESLGLHVDSMKRTNPRDRIVEATVNNLSSAHKTEMRIYGKMEPSEGVLPLNMNRVDAKRGDKFVVEASRHMTVKEFVKDFNTRKAEELKNVNLALEGEKLIMVVDGKRFTAKSYELDVKRSQIYLRTRFEPYVREVRFWNDGQNITPKFGDSWPIRYFGSSEHGLNITYEMNYRTITTRAAPEFLKERMPVEELSGRVKVTANKFEEGRRPIEVDDTLFGYMYGRISRQETPSAYFFERGGLGEDIGVAAASKMGLDLVERHPYDPHGAGREPYKIGADALFRTRETGELILVDFRWWKHSIAGLESDVVEMRGRREREKTHPRYGEVSGAYVASLDLDLSSNRGELHVKRAW